MQAGQNPPREVELKLAVAPSELAKVLAHPLFRERSDGPTTQKLLATYFDTPDHALQQAGISLRVRRNGDRRIQTIKAARSPEGVALARDEWEHEVEGDDPDYTLVKETALGPFLERRSTIRPVFRVETERTLHCVPFESSLIEVAADHSKIVGGERTVSFGELELELKEGTPADLFRLASALSAATPLRLSFATKAQRGFEAVAGGPPSRVKAPPIALERRMTSAAAFQRIGASCLQHLMANEAIVRHAPGADAVHQMRVALRRLRAAVSLFKTVVEDGRRDAVKAELKRMAQGLGEARNLDVYIANVLDPAMHEHGADERYRDFMAECRKRRDEAYRAVRETIASPCFGHRVLEVAAWIEAGPWLEDGSKHARQRRDRPVAALAEEELGRRWKKVIKRGRNLGTLDPEERHQVRIEVKKLRYAAEFFESLFKGHGAKKRKRAVMSRLEALQETLGELNDIAVGAHMGSSPAAEAIHREQMSRVEGLLADAEAHYRELAPLEPFWRS